MISPRPNPIQICTERRVQFHPSYSTDGPGGLDKAASARIMWWGCEPREGVFTGASERVVGDAGSNQT